MGLRAASQDPIMERMIGAVLALRSQRREAVGAAGLGLEVTTDLTWLSAAWRKHVLPKALVAASPGWIHRKYFELAVLAQVKDELKSGDLYIPHGERYDDYREQLVEEATFAQELEIGRATCRESVGDRVAHSGRRVGKKQKREQH